jgi:hypothetical protein
MTAAQLARRVQALELAQRDDDSVTYSIPASYVDAAGAVVHVAKPAQVQPGGKVDYRAGIWERDE